MRVPPISVPGSTITGLTSTQVLYGSSAGAIAQSSSLTWTDSAGTLTIINPTNVAGTEHGIADVRVGGTAGGDPQLRLTIPSGTSWYIGGDNSDSDYLKIGTGTAVGTATVITCLGDVNRTVQFGDGTSDVSFNFNLATAGVKASMLTVGATGGSNARVSLNNGRIWVEGDGRLAGNALHNNAGAMTGATNQYVGSGTYTPTLTNVANLAASTARLTQWIRVANVVFVAGQFDLDPTTTATLTQVGISLPIASAIANTFELGGTASAPSLSAANSDSAAIIGDAANDRAQIQWTPVDVSNQTWAFTFAYQVI